MAVPLREMGETPIITLECVDYFFHLYQNSTRKLCAQSEASQSASRDGRKYNLIH